MPYGWSKAGCLFWVLLEVAFSICFGVFYLVYFLQTKVHVLYAHMLNILFKVCEIDHLNRTGSCNSGGRRRDSFATHLTEVYAL